MIQSDSWGTYSLTAPAAYEEVNWMENELEAKKNLYANGQSIRLKRYYRKDGSEGSYQWVQCYPTSSELQSAPAVYDGASVNAPIDNLDGNIGEAGAYLWFNLYYTKSDSRSWTELNETPTSSVDGTFDYAFRNNHLAGYSNNDIVKVPDYSYYKVEQSGTAQWVQVDYVDGSTYSVPSYRVYERGTDVNDGSHNGSIGDYAVVLGEKKSYDGTNWVEYNAQSAVPDYSQMKFSYWSGSIEEAITSKYADGMTSNDIFQNCTKITKIEFLSGTVRGLNDHSPSQYANYEIVIGKDVTEIAAGAFNQSRSLTKLTFDKDYSNMSQADLANYPKPLIIGDQAFNDCSYLQEVEIPNRTVSIGNGSFKKVGNANIDINNVCNSDNAGRQFKVSFERRNKADEDAENDKTVGINCDFPLTIGESAFEDCYFIRHLSLPIRLESLGKAAFKNTVLLEDLVMRETTNAPYQMSEGHHLLKTIPTEAFSGSHVRDILIPMCVTLIEDNAFGSTNYLESVTFQMQKDAEGLPLEQQETLVIKSGAFAYGNEQIVPNLHVYVDINPAKRKIVCEYNAFNFTQMEGQTEEQNEHRGMLHFSEEYWDYYQGDWKRGLAFSQSNLNAFKDGYENPTEGYLGLSLDAIDTTTGKYETSEVGKQYTPANGWQQFVTTSTNVDIVIPGGFFIRSYSTPTTYEIPTALINMTETPLVEVYRITEFNDGWTESYAGKEDNAENRTCSATATQVEGYIPKNTGLIMRGNVNQGSYVAYLKELTDNRQEYPYNQTAGDANINYLCPTCIAPDAAGHAAIGHTLNSDGTKAIINPTKPYPIGSTEPSDSKYRLFGFVASDRSFYRSMPGVGLNRDMAYLMLPTSVFHWSNEQNGSSSGVNGQSASRVILSFDDDVQGGQTGVCDASYKSGLSDVFYTIQGVKVTRPQRQGLYIHNGKKIFVK